MSQPNKNEVATVLRAFAEKLASEQNAGAPDRLTTADGQGGITTTKPDIPSDSGEAALKADLPADAAANTSASEPGGSPDRLTVADGQGGITAAPGSIPADSGEAELKKDLPADGDTRKSARIARIRAAMTPGGGDGASASAPAAAPAAEQPTAPALQLNQGTLAKIASLTLATDEGIQFVHQLLEKQAGEEAAGHQIREAIQAAEAFDGNEQVKQAAFDGVAVNAERIYDDLVANGITEADADAVIKQASFHQEKIASFEHPLMKQAYAAGMDDAALLAAADEAAGDEGAPAMDEALPMGGEQLGEEEILALLQEMIDAGEISEEDVMAALAAEGGEGGEGAAAEELDPAAMEGDPAAGLDPAAAAALAGEV